MGPLPASDCLPGHRGYLQRVCAKSTKLCVLTSLRASFLAWDSIPAWKRALRPWQQSRASQRRSAPKTCRRQRTKSRKQALTPILSIIPPACSRSLPPVIPGPPPPCRSPATPSRISPRILPQSRRPVSPTTTSYAFPTIPMSTMPSSSCVPGRSSTSSASEKVSLRRTRSRMRSMPMNAACPSLQWNTSCLMPS